MMQGILKHGIVKIGAIALVSYSLNGCASLQAKTENKRPPVPVSTAVVALKNIPVQVKATGNVQAVNTVAVKSQIEGELTGVFFKQGDMVKQGQLLFTIDPRAANAALQQAIANQAKNQAQLKQAQANLSKAIADIEQAKATKQKDIVEAKKAEADQNRYRFLQQQGAVSKEQTEQYQTNLEALRANIEADQSLIDNKIAAQKAAIADLEAAQAQIKAGEAAIKAVQVDLSYTKIYAPISGKTGTLNINQGNLVKANDSDNPLVVISQVSPVYVSFPVAEKFLPQIQEYNTSNQLKVEVSNPNTGQVIEEGQLTFIDNNINVTTGTIQLKASFGNDKGKLAPGQFLQVALKLKEEKNALVVPTQAIQKGQKGEYVFVVKPDRTVEPQQVTLGITQGQETVIKEGLSQGQEIVTDGQFNLAPGTEVAIKATGNASYRQQAVDRR